MLITPQYFKYIHFYNIYNSIYLYITVIIVNVQHPLSYLKVVHSSKLKYCK